MQQHVNREASRQAINNLFPAAFFGYGKANNENGAKSEDEAYNQEIENLLRKYTATGNYRNYNNPSTLESRVGYNNAKDLRNEMAQAIKDLEMINREVSDSRK